MSLTREQILTKIRERKLKHESVDISEWGDEGDTIIVRELTGTERDKFESECTDPETGQLNYDNFRAKMAVACCMDDNGNPLFTEDDVKELGSGPCSPLSRIFQKANELSGLNKDKSKN